MLLQERKDAPLSDGPVQHCSTTLPSGEVEIPRTNEIKGIKAAKAINRQQDCLPTSFTSAVKTQSQRVTPTIFTPRSSISAKRIHSNTNPIPSVNDQRQTKTQQIKCSKSWKRRTLTKFKFGQNRTNKSRSTRAQLFTHTFSSSWLALQQSKFCHHRHCLWSP